MNETSSFFRWVYRLLAMAGLALALLIGYVAYNVYADSARWRNNRTVEVPKRDESGVPSTEKLRFADLETIAGPNTHMVRVIAEQEGRGSSFSGSYDASATRNLIFLDPGYGEARWLFADNRALIGRIEKLCACEVQDGKPVFAIYLEVRNRDTDGNRLIDRSDLVQPAIVLPDGSGYRTLMTPVREVLDADASDDGNSFGLLVNTGAAIVYREFGTGDWKLRSERELTRIGAQETR